MGGAEPRASGACGAVEGRRAGGGGRAGWGERRGHRSQSKAEARASPRPVPAPSQCRAPLAAGTGKAARSLHAPLSPTERLWASATSGSFAPPPPSAAVAAGDDRHPASSPLGIYSWQDGARCRPFPASVQVWGGRWAPSVPVRHRFSCGRSAPFLLLLPCPISFIAPPPGSERGVAPGRR